MPGGVGGMFQVEVDRLLADDGEPSISRAAQVAGVGVRGRSDEHRVDAVGVERSLEVVCGLSAVLAS